MHLSNALRLRCQQRCHLHVKNAVFIAVALRSTIGNSLSSAVSAFVECPHDSRRIAMQKVEGAVRLPTLLYTHRLTMRPL